MSTSSIIFFIISFSIYLQLGVSLHRLIIDPSPRTSIQGYKKKDAILSLIIGYSLLGTTPSLALDIDERTISKPVSPSYIAQSTGGQPPAVADIMRDRFAALRSAVTGEKVTQLRVGDTLVERLRSVDGLLDDLQKDLYKDNALDWEVIEVYPKVFRAYSKLFTAYTDRAFPDITEIDKALRYALRYEVGGFYTGVQDFEKAVEKKSQRQAQRAFARMSIAYDHYLKAGDLYSEYEGNMENTDAYYDRQSNMLSYTNPTLNFIAPSIEAPGLQDEVVLLKGPDKGRIGVVLWIFKDEKFSNNIVVKLNKGESGHSEVRQYPYSLVAKTTPPAVQFADDLLAAYIASAISSGIMYPIDSYKTRIQTGRKGIPDSKDGGPLGLWKGVQWFIADPNDAIYVATYGIFKPALLAPIDVTNPLAVFTVLSLSGSLGDAVGSIFRVPLELTYKRVQTGVNVDGGKTLLAVLRKENFQTLLLSWVAVLCRDVPFAGLQIAFFDVYKTLFSSLDDLGLSLFLQRALWGAFAGGTAAVLTTPFDNLTTNLMTAGVVGGQKAGEGGDDSSDSVAEIQADSLQLSLQTKFSVAWTELLQGGLTTIFAGAIPRIFFFSPAAMIFFACYETFTEVIMGINSGAVRLQLPHNIF